MILLFVLLIMSTTSVIVKAGGFQGILNHLFKYAKTKRSLQVFTVLTGLIIFVDDYINTMIVGSGIRPMISRFGVSKEKLAFLVDATSAPVAGLAFVSTWIGYEAGLFDQMAKTLSINSNGYKMFLDALPYRFYCLFMLLFVFMISFFMVDFGPMKKAEEEAGAKTGRESSQDRPVKDSGPVLEMADNIRVSARTAVIPIALLFSVLIAGFWIDGAGWSKAGEDLFNSFNPYIWKDVLIESSHNKEIFFISVLAGAVSSYLCAFFIAKLGVGEINRGALVGLRSAILPALILILAWSLKALLDDLRAGQYIVSLFGTNLTGLTFPAIVFVTAGVLSFFTGTSYGTMSILIPLVVPVAFIIDGSTYGLTTMISMGAVLDGAIFGDHCSPISDTTIMSSISTGCDHISHVRTQLPYSLFVAFLALVVGYIPASFGLPSYFSLLIGTALMLVIIFLLNAYSRRSFSLHPP